MPISTELALLLGGIGFVLLLVIGVLSVQLYQALYCRQEVQALAVAADHLQGFLAANPQFCTAADFRLRLREMGEKAAPLTAQFHQLVATLSLDRPGAVIVFRTLTT